MKTSTVTDTHRFTDGRHITDIIAIDETNYLVAAKYGLLKTTKDQLINHYHIGKSVMSLCHVTHSLYLVGFLEHGLILWNELTDQLLSMICGGTVFSIKRVITNNNYLIKTWYRGVKVVTFNDLMPINFSVKHLLDAADDWNFTENLQLQITNSHITIATNHNEYVDLKYKSSIKLMKYLSSQKCEGKDSRLGDLRAQTLTTSPTFNTCL
jgi:hypothetical protein